MTARRPRWIGITRVSSAGQVDNGAGLDVQADAIRAWVRRRGDKLNVILADAGVGGKMEDLAERHALHDAMILMREGKADGIVVYRLDRLARDTFLQESLYRDVMNAGCRLASVDEAEMDALEAGTDDPTRVFIRKILWAFAEYERAMITFRCIAGKRRKAARGGFIGGRSPYGYHVDKGELVENPAEIALIAQALTMREMGCSYRQIGEFWAGSEFRLHYATEWRANTIRQVLDRAKVKEYPRPAPMGNLAKAYAGMQLDPKAV